MRLDVKLFRYLSSDDFRVLTAIEMGSRNHEVVPTSMVVSIAKLGSNSQGSIYKILSELCRRKLIQRISASSTCAYEGYRLGYGGYDYLALRTFLNREIVGSIGNQIGTGKESDIYIVADQSGECQHVLKIHRLGRTSFRTVKTNRDYLRHRKTGSWLYLSRLAAAKEFAFMKALYEYGFPVPKPIDCNRHCLLMELLNAVPLYQVDQLVHHPGRLFANLIGLIKRLAEHGLIHGDFNEFNILVTEDNDDPIIIDFPQMVSVNHENAKFYLDRDIECIKRFFRRRFDYVPESEVGILDWDLNSIKATGDIDLQVQASGYSKQHVDCDPSDIFLLDPIMQFDCDEEDEEDEEDQEDQSSQYKGYETYDETKDFDDFNDSEDSEEGDRYYNQKNIPSNTSASKEECIKSLESCLGALNVSTGKGKGNGIKNDLEESFDPHTPYPSSASEIDEDEAEDEDKDEDKDEFLDLNENSKYKPHRNANLPQPSSLVIQRKKQSEDSVASSAVFVGNLTEEELKKRAIAEARRLGYKGKSRPRSQAKTRNRRETKQLASLKFF